MLKIFVFSSGCHLEKPWVEVISVGVPKNAQSIRRVKLLKIVA
jgi:hypothetical protein